MARLRALSRPFLNWTGKAERLSFDVPTLPLFVHERLSTRAIKGYGPLEDMKRAAAERWCAAVNLNAAHGLWSYAVATAPGQVRAILDGLVGN
jgi:hypothetical protein